MSRPEPKSKLMHFVLYTYDLLPDSEGGYSVNDVYRQGKIEVRAKRTVFNEGTPLETRLYLATDRQLNRAVGAQGLTWDGEEGTTLYATDKKGNPACELRRIQEV